MLLPIAIATLAAAVADDGEEESSLDERFRLLYGFGDKIAAYQFLFTERSEEESATIYATLVAWVIASRSLDELVERYREYLEFIRPAALEVQPRRSIALQPSWQAINPVAGVGSDSLGEAVLPVFSPPSRSPPPATTATTTTTTRSEHGSEFCTRSATKKPRTYFCLWTRAISQTRAVTYSSRSCSS